MSILLALSQGNIMKYHYYQYLFNSYRTMCFSHFRRLLTPGIYAKLSSPEQLVAALNTDTQNFRIIWNEDTRNELRTYLDEQIIRIK